MVDVAKSHDDTNARREGVRHGNAVHPTNPFVRFEEEEVEQSIVDRFEQQVAKFPDRLAVKTGNLSLTYTELNAASNRVGRAILAQDGEGERPVAVLLGNSAELITVSLGTWKAGKFNVLLEPSYPATRLSYFIEDSGAPLLVTSNKYLGIANELAQSKAAILNIDEIDPHVSLW